MNTFTRVTMCVGLTITLTWLLYYFNLFETYAPYVGSILIICALFKYILKFTTYIKKKYWKQIFFFKLRCHKIFYTITRCIFRLIQPFCRKDTFILFDNLYEANAECIDAYSVFRYMQEHGVRSYYIIWKNNRSYDRIMRETNSKCVITLNEPSKSKGTYFYEFWEKCWYKLLRTKVLITSFGELHPSITRFIYKNKYITYQHIDHGVVMLKEFILTTDYFSHKKFNKFLVSNAYESELFQKHGWNKQNLPIIGLPRWDLLKKSTGKQKKIFIFFTWRRSFGPWFKNVYKTSIEKSQYFINIRSLISNKELKDVLKKHNIKLQFAFHHALLDQCKNISNPRDFIGNDVEIVDASNIQPFIGQADLFITDYSSLFFDFAFLNTPIVFYYPDVNDQTLVADDINDRTHALAQKDRLYNVCSDVDSVVYHVKRYIKNDFTLEDEYKKLNDALFSCKKDIRKRFVDYLTKL